MKRILLGGTALAAAMAAMPASAQDRNVTSGLQLNITGFVAFEAGLLLSSDDDDDNDRDYDFNSNGRLEFEFENVTDSGLEYGALIRMDNINRRQDVTVDRQYLYVSGSFGRFDFGDTPTVAGDFGYFFAPDNILNSHGGYGDNLDGNYRYGGGDFFSLDPTYRSGMDKSTSIKYVTPSIGGFIFGLDFHPVLSVDNRDLSNGTQGRADLFDEGQIYENAISAGLVYDSEFDGTRIRLGGTATYANGIDDIDDGIADHFDLETYSLGGLFASGPITGSLVWVYTPSGFTGGDSLRFDDDGNAIVVTDPDDDNFGDIINFDNTDTDVHTLAAALGYSWGAFNFGLAYAYTWADSNTLAGDLSGNSFDLDDNHIAVATVNYTLAPGLNTYAEILYEVQNYKKELIRLDEDTVTTRNRDTSWDQTTFLTGISVAF